MQQYNERNISFDTLEAIQKTLSMVPESNLDSFFNKYMISIESRVRTFEDIVSCAKNTSFPIFKRIIDKAAPIIFNVKISFNF